MWKGRSDAPFNFVWSNCNKINGVFFGVNSTFNNCCLLLHKVKKCVNMYSGRNLTLFGRSMIANTVIAAQLWYIGSIIILPETLITAINRCLFKFVWRNKIQCINRRTLTQPPENGGLNLVHIKTKLASLRCAHLKQLVEGSQSNWTAFAVYYIGHQIKEHKPEYAANNRPHAKQPSAFYVDVLNALKQYKSINKSIKTSDLNAKSTYKCLLELDSVQPVIEKKLTNVNFNVAWKAVSNQVLSPWARDISWRLLHNVLPVAAHLYHLHITRNATCVYCNWPETFAHCFYSCKYVRSLWCIVENWMSNVTGQPFVITQDVALYLQNTIQNTEHLKLFLIVFAELKYTI